MMTVDPFTAQLQSAVLTYFAGERHEIWLTLELSLLVCVLVICLWLNTRTGFAAALALTTVVTTGLLAGGAASLLSRDRGLASSIVQVLDTDQQEARIATERERISVVRSKYRYYRIGALAIGLAALLCLALSHRGWVHGLAVGLLLLVMAQTLIDHYSEQRANRYFSQLSAGHAGE